MRETATPTLPPKISFSMKPWPVSQFAELPGMESFRLQMISFPILLVEYGSTTPCVVLVEADLNK